MATPNMFAALEQTDQLVEAGHPDEAYRVMKEAVEADTGNFARTFLNQWMRHLEEGEAETRNKFAEILIYLKQDFSGPADQQEPVAEEPSPSPSSAMPVWLAPLTKPFLRKPEPEPMKREVPATPSPPTVSVPQEQPASEVPTPTPAVEPETPSQPAPEPVKDETQTPSVLETQEESSTEEETREEPVMEPTIEGVQSAEDTGGEVVTEETGEAEKEQEEPEQQEALPEPIQEPTPVAEEAHTPAAPVAQEPAVEEKEQTETSVAELNPEDLEQMTLTFYEWQMAAIQKAAMKEKTDEPTLVANMLETGDIKPLMWSRYKHGSPSPNKRITIALPHRTKLELEQEKYDEGIKTTTRYVRVVLFGDRADKA